MHWYLVHTKPKQEQRALENLERQGYPCYLPTIFAEKIRRKLVITEAEPLFPRYLFIKLGLGDRAKSWAPIHSTTGVSRLVSFGLEPTKVADGLIDFLKSQKISTKDEPKRLFKPGETVHLTDAPFCGIEGIYQMASGEHRAMVLIELLSKPLAIKVPSASLRKAG